MTDNVLDCKTEMDPNGIAPHEPGAKLDAGKMRPWLMLSGFPRALAAVADVTTRGAEKYTDHGWAQVPDGVERYMEGFARHTLALGRGEVHDDGPGGTGCLHKAQMIWNLMASLELELREAAAWARPALVLEPESPQMSFDLGSPYEQPPVAGIKGP